MLDILGIKFYDGSIDTIVTVIIETCLGSSKREARCVSATGAHGLVLAKQDEGFARVLKKFYLNLPDGVPAVWIGRLKGARHIERCYGPLFFELVMRASARTPIKHFFCGGKEGVPDELRNVCASKFGNENCVGSFSPPFREMSELELRILAKAIDANGVDIIWIGVSTPKQEILALKLATFANVHYIVTVGAAFDFHTGRLRQAPHFLQRMGMEWFFRLLTEPKRLWRRYIWIVPFFAYYGFLDIIQHVIKNQRNDFER